VWPLFRDGTPSPAETESTGTVPVQPEDTARNAPVAMDSGPATPVNPPVAAPIVAAAPSAAPPAVKPPPRRVTTSTLNRWALTWANVRSGPGSDYPVLRVLRPGQRVQVADASRGWWTVYQDGVPDGYVANSVLSDRSPPPDSLPAR
jgi:hypothetical protein